MLLGSTIQLECEIHSDSKFDVKWFKETTEIDSDDSKFGIKNDLTKCQLTLRNIGYDDSGRYMCEVTNKSGKVSTFARVLAVDDPKILKADEKLKKR